MLIRDVVLEKKHGCWFELLLYVLFLSKFMQKCQNMKVIYERWPSEPT